MTDRTQQIIDAVRIHDSAMAAVLDQINHLEQTKELLIHERLVKEQALQSTEIELISMQNQMISMKANFQDQIQFLITH